MARHGRDSPELGGLTGKFGLNHLHREAVGSNPLIVGGVRGETIDHACNLLAPMLVGVVIDFFTHFATALLVPAATPAAWPIEVACLVRVHRQYLTDGAETTTINFDNAGEVDTGTVEVVGDGVSSTTKGEKEGDDSDSDAPLAESIPPT